MDGMTVWRSAAAVTGAQADSLAQVFLGAGVAGGVLLLALFALRALYNRITALADQERQRADRLEEELRKRNAELSERTLGLLVDATRVLGQVLDERDRR